VPRRLAVDRDKVDRIGPPLGHPGGEAGREEFRVDPVHHDPQPVLAGHAPVIGLEAAQKGEMRLAPGGDLVVVVAARDRRTDDE
jgi:hypothetical protein